VLQGDAKTAGLSARRIPIAPRRRSQKMLAFEVGREHHVWRQKPRLAAYSAVYGLNPDRDDV
jgi:hypothetical protein